MKRVEQPWYRSTRRPSVGGCEQVCVDVALHVTAERRSLGVGGPEVDTRPDPCFKHLVRQIGEPSEAPLLTRNRLLVA